MGMATGIEHDLSNFVDSLRRTGHRGHIILGVNADISKSRLDYLEKRGATPKFIEFSNGTFEPSFKQEDIKRTSLMNCLCL